jgi:hypothetical protein
MLRRGVLATVDVKKVAVAHVQVHQAMEDCGACGRYFCFERVVRRLEEAIEVESGLDMHGLLSGGGGRRQVLLEGDRQEIIESNLDNSKLSKLTLQASQRLSCKQCCKISWP